MALSKIEWTDYTFNVLLFRMDSLMARQAQGDAVRDVKAQFRIFCERLNMVGAQIPAAVVAALLASKVIPAEHIKAPTLVFCRKSLVSSFGCLAIFVRMARGATGYFLRVSQALANTYAFLSGARYPFSWVRFTFMHLAHDTFCLLCVRFAFECRNASLVTFGFSDATTSVAYGTETIESTAVFTEVGICIAPFFTTRTALLSGFYACQIIVKAHVCFLRGDLKRSVRCLGHWVFSTFHSVNCPSNYTRGEKQYGPAN